MVQRLILCTGPETPHDEQRFNGSIHTVQSLSQRVDPILADLARRGEMYRILDCKPVGNNCHTCYILAGEPPQSLTVAPPPLTKLYKLDEAAELLDVSRATVGALARAGEIKCVRAGRSVRIPVEEIARIRAGSPVSS